MSSYCRRVVIASGLSFMGMCSVASAQASLGIGTAAHREAESRILRQFESRDSFVVTEMPLRDFVQTLRERFGINVHLDRLALDEVGFDTATPVTVDLRDSTLESCLNLVLESLHLAWTIRHESLVFTTPEEAEVSLETRVYPVRDLVLLEYQRTVDADFDSLIHLITSTVEPDSWDEVGGPGAVEPEIGSLSLVISQTWQAHRRIEPLLATLRTVREMQGIAPARFGSVHASAAKPRREYRATARSGWQRPRVYEN